MFSKKINLFLLLLTLAAGAQAQKTTVQGNIKGLTGRVIFKYDTGTAKKSDTVNVKNGMFTWEVKLPEPEIVVIYFPKEGVFFYADRGEIRITGQADALQQLSISGSALQREADAYNASIKDFTDQQKMERLARYINEHPKSYLSVNLITAIWVDEYRVVKSLYDLLDPAIQQSVRGKYILERLAILKRSVPGEPMLDFTMNSASGKPVRFADFKGKYVYVDIWASYCSACRAENPNMLEAYNRYKDKNFTILGLSVDFYEEAWKKALREDKLPWTQVSGKGKSNEVYSYYGVEGIPSSLLVGPDGKIIAKNLSGEGLNKKLAELLDK